jgi:hypothetical protein
LKTYARRSSASLHAVRPPPALDPIVEQELERLAAQYASAQRDAEAVLSDPARADRIRSITNRLNQSHLDPLVRAVLSRPEIYETCLAEVLASEEEDAPDARLARAVEALVDVGHKQAQVETRARTEERASEAQIASAIRDVGQAISAIVTVQEKQAETLHAALSELRATQGAAGSPAAPPVTTAEAPPAGPAPAPKAPGGGTQR